MQPGECCNEITKFSQVKTTPSRKPCHPLSREYIYIYIYIIYIYSRQQPPEAARRLRKCRRCLQLPAAACTGHGSGPCLGQDPCAWEGVPAERAALGAGPKGWVHHLEEQGQEVAHCFSCLAKLERPYKSGLRRGQAKPVVCWCYKYLNNTK